jgi:hypothetical protein
MSEGIMNKNIELIEKWLADKSSVTLDELRQAKKETAAAAAQAAVIADTAADLANAAADAVIGLVSADAGHNHAAASCSNAVAYHVKKYKKSIAAL